MIESSWEVQWTLVGPNAPCWVPIAPAESALSIQNLQWIFGDSRQTETLLAVLVRQTELAIQGELTDDGIFNESEAVRVWHGAELALVVDALYPDIPTHDWAVLLDLREFLRFITWLEHIRVAPKDETERPEGFVLQCYGVGPEAHVAFGDARVAAGLAEQPYHDPDLNQL